MHSITNVLTARDKVKASKVTEEYLALFICLAESIKIDLNTQASRWSVREGLNETLCFHNPPVYLYVQQNDVYELISSSQDASISYAFFMLRYVQGESARKLEHNFILTTDKSKKVAYDKLDVYRMFEYFKGGNLKLIEKNNKVSESVKTLFKQNADHFNSLVKNVYSDNTDLCNVLQTVEKNLQLGICFHAPVNASRELLSALLCLEIFHSVNNEIFCPKLLAPDDL